jgi:hypothetical protein
VSERSTGGYWRSPQITDDLTPGQPPYPSTGHEGPPVSLPLEHWQQLKARIELIGEQVGRTRFDYVSGTSGGQTDSSGNAVVGLYQVAAGIEARLRRLTGNARVPGTNVYYTPATTFSAAGAYIVLFQADSPDRLDALDYSGMLDFGPPTAAGPIFPFVMTDDSQQAAFVRGPAWFVVQVAAGPASAPLTFRYQLELQREQGIA